MRRIVIASLVLAAAIVSVASVATGARHRLALDLGAKPTTGYPTTRFVVSFTALTRTGRIGSTIKRYSVLATGPCGGRTRAGVPPTHRGVRIRITLIPRPSWCVGVIRGQLQETDGFYCPGVCAGPAERVRTIARFSVRIVAPPGTDRTPPVFAGLQSAFACTPGPQTPGETTPFTLTWQPAYDAQTPANEIVYALFMATTSGGEDFAHPNWTTAPGVMTFKTPGLASHGTFYFVVRARDQAGNEDQNRVERRGMDPCL